MIRFRLPALAARIVAAAALVAAVGAPLSAPLAPAAQAQTLDLGQIVQAGLRPGWRMPDGNHMAALHITLADNWKTYWRTPGDAGIPPRFDWTGSENVASMTAHWPQPVVFEQSGMRSIGYARELVLPLEFTLTDPAAPAQLVGRIEIGVCEAVCVPVTLDLRADLPRAGGDDRAIRAALAAQPRPASDAGLRAAACAVAPISDGLRVTATLDLPRLGASEVVVFELPDRRIWISDSVTQREGGRLVATSDMVPPSGAPFGLDRSALRITVLGDGRAADLRGCPAP